MEDNETKPDLQIDRSFLKVKLNDVETDQVRRGLASQLRANPRTRASTDDSAPTEEIDKKNRTLIGYGLPELDQRTEVALSSLLASIRIAESSFFTLGGPCPPAILPWGRNIFRRC